MGVWVGLCVGACARVKEAERERKRKREKKRVREIVCTRMCVAAARWHPVRLVVVTINYFTLTAYICRGVFSTGSQKLPDTCRPNYRGFPARETDVPALLCS